MGDRPRDVSGGWRAVDSVAHASAQRPCRRHQYQKPTAFGGRDLSRAGLQPRSLAESMDCGGFLESATTLPSSPISETHSLGGAGFIPRGASGWLQPRSLANQWIAGGFLKSVPRRTSVRRSSLPFKIHRRVCAHFRNGELSGPGLHAIVFERGMRMVECRETAFRIRSQHSYAEALHGGLAIVE